MARMPLMLVALSVASLSMHASAQDHLEPTIDRHGRYPDHHYWHHEPHVPDIIRLDADSDRLAAIARHLHEDAHGLSQDHALFDDHWSTSHHRSPVARSHFSRRFRIAH